VKILAVDKLNDLALLKVKDPIGEMPAAPLAPSAKMKLGQTVFTLGFPNSDLQGFNVKMTKGEISSTTGLQDDPRQFQISVPLQPGNSGGALFDDQGNIIGIVVAKLSESVAKKYTGNTPENVNYAVKSSYVFPLIEQSKTQLNSPIEGPVPKLEDVVERIKDACVMVLVEE
jgi:S1-C subfamily serine protease